MSILFSKTSCSIKGSRVLMNIDFKLLFPVLSVNIALYLKGVASIVNVVTLTYFFCTEGVVIAALDISAVMMKNEE